MERDPTYIARLMALPDRERRMLLYGVWDIANEGLVYDDFDTMRHVVEPFEIPEHWTRLRSIDFGYNNPFVCLWLALSPDDELYLYREIYETARLVSDLADEITALTGHERIVVTVADHDVENRAELNRRGVPTVPAIKRIQEGISEVRARLAADRRGRSRLYVLRDSTVRTDARLAAQGAPTSTREEFAVYRYGESAVASTEAPLDLHDHGMDALRYACMYLRHRRQQATRWRSVSGI